ncbi:ABC transporter ATP-binding protein [Salinispora sp. H7-4]|uniref:ABC transporter ATP-binding protein n=1 Tax=Salinispora sp. H7-4 TaxID=2748321 RepID=UPI0015D1BBB6|nr:ABC transporter ATP-binding protein [Salinispora sp. H7-4]NYT93999.1 ABC transporter ATP-binding protein [Salinispora sp. H7-4]
MGDVRMAEERPVGTGAEKQPDTAKEQFDTAGLKALLTFARPYRKTLVVGVGLGLFGSGAALAQPLAAREVLERVGQDGDLLRPILFLVALVLGGAALSGIQLFILERSGERMVLGLRLTLVHRLLRLRMKEYDRRSTGDLLSTAGADTTLLRSVITANVLDSVSAVVTLVGAIALMAYLDWVQLVSVLAVLLVVGVGVVPALNRIRTATERAQEGLGQMTAGLERALGAIRTVKASVSEERESERISAWARTSYAAGVRSIKLDAVVGVASGLAVQLSFLMVLGVGGVRVANGSISAADLVAFLLYILYLASPIIHIVNAVTQLQKASAATTRIVTVNDMEVEPVPGSAAPVVGEAVPLTGAGDTAGPPAPFSGTSTPFSGASASSGGPPSSVTFENVSFGYRAGVPVLREVSFHIPAGAQAALVGPSGVGKTTVLGLLERFYEPETGRVLLGDRDVADVPLNELRRQIGYVEQEAPALAGTLRENLLYTAPAATDDQLNAVVAASRLGALVRRLPDGLDTEIGDRGTQLSGGERQRLAIGRLLLSRPRLVLLDEATSQLDSVNEAALREAVEELAAGCTMLVIAHRLSTVAASDVIVLMGHGGVRRTGTHDELMAEDELYRELARGQLLSGDRTVAAGSAVPTEVNG